MRYHQSLLTTAAFGLLTSFGGIVNTPGVLQDASQPLLEVSDLIKQGQAIERKQFGEAVKLYEKALAIALDRKHLASEAHALLRIGDAIDGNQPVRAVELLERSLTIFRELGDRARQGDCLIALTSAARYSSQYERAMGYSLALEQMARELDHKIMLMHALNGVAGVYRERGQSSKAIEKYQEAASILRGMDGPKGSIATVLNNMASAYADMANYRRAKEIFEESRAVAQEARDPIAESLALANLGNILTKMGETQQALEYLQLALPLNPDNNYFKSYCFHQMAVLYDILGDLLKFFEYAQQALAMRLVIQDRRSAALSYADISNFYETVGQLGRAEECLKESARLIEGTDYTLGKVQVLCKIGDFYLRQRKPAPVKDLIDRARAIMPGVEGNLAILAVEGLHSDYLRSTGRLEEAMEAAEKGLAVAVRSDEARREADFLMNIGSMETSLKRFPEARRRFDAALAVARRIQYLEAEVDILSRIGQLLEDQNRSAEASETYAKALTLIETSRESLGDMSEHKLGFQNVSIPIYQRYVSLQLRANRIDRAFEWTQKSKARVLLDMMASGRVTVAQAMTDAEKQQESDLLKRGKELTQQWLAAEGELNELKSDKSPPERVKQAESRLLAIKSQQQEHERQSTIFREQLYARNPRLAHQRAARIATLQEVAAALPDGSALLEYCVLTPRAGEKTRDEVVLFVVTREGGRPRLASFRCKNPSGSITRLAADLREACSIRPGTSAEKSYRSVSRQLYDSLIAPASHLIAGKERLIICPDGPLWDVPFQALLGPGKPKSKFLWERFAIGYGYSATGMKAALEVRGRPNRPRPQRSMLVMANPDFGGSAASPLLPESRPRTAGEDRTRGLYLRGGSLDSLPHTQQEANSIAAAFPGTTVKTDAHAQESLLKSEGDRFRLMHFATHALVNDAAPMLSGVVLSRPPKDSKEDGILTVRELFTMNLAADMIVFSACETARGARRQGEGLIGLTWAAFAAGVPTQIVSQWSVDDRATATLMGRFYRELRKGKSKDTALRTAALGMMGDGKHSHPFYWAPFLLVGDWR